MKSHRGGPITLNSKTGVLVEYAHGPLSVLQGRYGRLTGMRNRRTLEVCFEVGVGAYYCSPQSLKRVMDTNRRGK